MDIRRMRIFAMVAHKKSFTQAARQLYMSQPAISKAIAELEEELQTPLFERFPKSVEVTPQGAALLEAITPLLAHYEDVVTHAQTIHEQFTLHIGSSITIANEALCTWLGLLQKQFPSLRIQVMVASSAAILSALRNQQLDLAFVEGIVQGEEWQVLPLTSYALMPVASPAFLQAHPLSSFQDLAHAPLLLREEGSAIREVVESSFRLQAVPCVPSWTSTNSSALLKAAIQGFGVTFLPQRMVQKKLNETKLKSICLPNAPLQNHSHIVYLTHKHLNEAMLALIAIAGSDAYHSS